MQIRTMFLAVIAALSLIGGVALAKDKKADSKIDCDVKGKVSKMTKAQCTKKKGKVVEAKAAEPAKTEPAKTEEKKEEAAPAETEEEGG